MHVAGKYCIALHAYIAHVYVCAYACACIYMYRGACGRPGVLCMYLYMCMYVCMYAFMSVSDHGARGIEVLHVCMYVCMCIYCFLSLLAQRWVDEL